MKQVKLMQGDNMESLKKLPDNSIDSVVTDPPYGLSFMNKKWDYDVPSVEFWSEVYRVLKPGGHVLSFGGTRTYHRMVVNIEDAGFEIRDQIQWIYGSGFPKSHNIGKAVDKLEGNEREFIGVSPNDRPNSQVKGGMAFDNAFNNGQKHETINISKGTSPYEGWGTALKPANEPICVARKPLSEKSVAENVLKWGTGGINVDGCRVGYTSDSDKKSAVPGSLNHSDENYDGIYSKTTLNKLKDTWEQPEGRFPANIILECICDEVIKGEKGEIKSNTRKSNDFFDKYKEEGEKHKEAGITTRIENYGDSGDIHTDPNCPCRLLDEQSGESKSNKGVGNRKPSKNNIIKWSNTFENGLDEGYNDKGGASRFFYQAKVSKAERNMGLDGFEEKLQAGAEFRPINMKKALNGEDGNPYARYTPTKNNHPTVKPINLMAYLCRLITPPGGIVLDPFMGSGSTGVAAQLEGFRFVGMEMDPEYFKIASARIDSYEKYKKFKK